MASLLGGCAEGASFDTKLAPGFSAAHHTLSVFGVYKDGQMSSEAWATIGDRLTPWLGQGACPVGYASVAPANDGALVAAIDDYARAIGPTDELLAQLAPAAKGDLILTVTLAGRPPTPEKVAPLSSEGNSGGGAGGGGGMGGSRGRTGQPSGAERRSHAPVDTNELDIVASLFSVSQGHSVAEVSMAYSGQTVDDALAKFAQRLSATFPGATCSGWDWTKPIDPNRIRASAATTE
jgi:hypothetical protein